MSSLTGGGGRALLLRLVLAELLAKRGEGPLAPRFVARARNARAPLAGESTPGRASTAPADQERA